ncbi:MULTISPECIES: O-antigen ligase family protein [Myroides]|uniref:O-antigen ligase family protein n=1 Tax=Myroides TaxID=76831 RepID=UPI001E49F2CC|nr:MULTISPECIES: O-antigen ligase family protein [Myroides]
MEKYLSLLLFPIFIIGNYRDIRFKFILLNYARITLGLTIFFFIRFIILYPENVDLYLQGVHLWEAGYVFVDSFGNHAPNVNLHLAFVTSIIFYYFLQDYYRSSVLKRVTNLVCIIALIVLIFVINTRVALFLVFIDCFLIVFYFLKKSTSFKFGLKQRILLISFVVLSLTGSIYTIAKVPYYKDKFSTFTFGYMDKVGKLDEIQNPESKVYNSLALRLSVWKSVWAIYQESNPLIGIGVSDFDQALYHHYEETEQSFLRKHELGPHNQYIESLAKFGILGLLSTLCFLILPFTLGYRMKFVLMMLFSFNMLFANLFDGYLYLFMGIVYSGWMISLFGAYYLQFKSKLESI